MTTKDPIARTSLHTEVTARLRSLIVESQIKPGERVPELEISKELGVSRTPIREALKVLASEGLVDLLPLRGAVVKAFSDKDASDMLEVMGLLENFAAQKACQADQKKIDKVLAIHEKMKVMFAKGKRPEYFELNQKIHDSLIALPGNDTLIGLHATLSKRMRRIRFTGNTMQVNWDEAMQEHESMMDALNSKDFSRLAKTMEQHILNTWPRLQRIALTN